ncbi:MAG: hypothetical protein A6F72_08780 [Cycloclasticus sp. symbiont of Poecilosclerida sp. N]|nr:MAG: hypothetical protein A6F72_08780 [Cycloclasticus sp. symbiont of Poecilosclerida sp. N]
MGKLIFLAPLATAILVLTGMACFGDGGVDWLITNSVVIVTAAIFAGYFINFYKKYQNAFDFGFVVLFFVVIINFMIGVILSESYFWLFTDIYMVIVYVSAAVRLYLHLKLERL